jgi:hypothetical protein
VWGWRLARATRRKCTSPKIIETRLVSDWRVWLLVSTPVKHAFSFGNINFRFVGNTWQLPWHDVQRGQEVMPMRGAHMQFCLRSLRSLTRCACIQMHRTFRGICALTNTWAAACPTLHSELKERAAPVMGAYTLWGTVWSMASCSTTHGQTVYSCKSHLDVRFASTCPPTCLLSILIIGVF